MHFPPPCISPRKQQISQASPWELALCLSAMWPQRSRRQNPTLPVCRLAHQDHWQATGHARQSCPCLSSHSPRVSPGYPVLCRRQSQRGPSPWHVSWMECSYWHHGEPRRSAICISTIEGKPWVSLISQLVKNPPAMQETLVQVAAHSSILGLPLWLSW